MASTTMTGAELHHTGEKMEQYFLIQDKIKKHANSCLVENFLKKLDETYKNS